MSSGASPRRFLAGLALAAAVAVAAGCSSPTKEHYLRHLSLVIEPLPEGEAAALVAAPAAPAAPAVAAVGTGESGAEAP